MPYNPDLIYRIAEPAPDSTFGVNDEVCPAVEKSCSLLPLPPQINCKSVELLQDHRVITIVKLASAPGSRTSKAVPVLESQLSNFSTRSLNSR